MPQTSGKLFSIETVPPRAGHGPTDPLVCNTYYIENTFRHLHIISYQQKFYSFADTKFSFHKFSFNLYVSEDQWSRFSIDN